MNDKLRKHVDILFAAAPRNQKTAEIKEELLTNLNDKYNDLMSNGYDSTAAFHIALSGIGDIDELLKECGEPVQPNVVSTSPMPQTSRLPIYSVLAFLLFCAFPVLPVIVNVFSRSFTWELFCFFLVWVFAGSVVLYGIVSSYTRQSGGAESTTTVPIFSKRKIVRMLMYLGLAIGILLFVDLIWRFNPYNDLRWLFSLCYLIAGGFYIYALVSLLMKEPTVIPAQAGIQTEGGQPVFIKPKTSQMPLLLGLAFALIVLAPIIGVVCFGHRVTYHGSEAIYYGPPLSGNGIVFILLCWGIAGSILVYAIATLFTRRTGNAVIPAQAGIQTEGGHVNSLDPRLRGGDGKNVSKLRQVMFVLLIALPLLGIGALAATSLFQNYVSQTQPLAMVEKPVNNGLPFKMRFLEEGGYEELSVTIYFAIRKTDERWFDRRYKEHEQEIFDKIATILRASSPEERLEGGLSAIKERISRTVNEILGDPIVWQVFFTEMRGEIVHDDPRKE